MESQYGQEGLSYPYTGYVRHNTTWNGAGDNSININLSKERYLGTIAVLRELNYVNGNNFDSNYVFVKALLTSAILRVGSTNYPKDALQVISTGTPYSSDVSEFYESYMTFFALNNNKLYSPNDSVSLHHFRGDQSSDISFDYRQNVVHPQFQIAISTDSHVSESYQTNLVPSGISTRGVNDIRLDVTNVQLLNGNLGVAAFSRYAGKVIYTATDITYVD
jgi:hypothetical protein